MANNHDLVHQSIQELAATIESKDRKYRLARLLLAILLVAGMGLLLVVGLNTLQGVRTQLSEQKKLLDSQQQILSGIQASSRQSAAQINDLQNHIDCVVELFQHPNRSSLSITQLQGCQLTSSATGQSTITQPKTSSATSTSQPTATHAATPQATANPQPATSAPMQGFGLGNALNSIKKALGL